MPWKRIPGFPRYAINHCGRIRSYARKTMHYLAISYYKESGYAFANIGNANGFRKCKIHRLVWLTFRGKIPKPLQINHIDGDKTNNHLSNLELVTASENVRHSYRTGASKPRYGEDNSSARFTLANITSMRKRHANGERVSAIALDYDTEPSVISKIVRRERWKHV